MQGVAMTAKSPKSSYHYELPFFPLNHNSLSIYSPLPRYGRPIPLLTTPLALLWHTFFGYYLPSEIVFMFPYHLNLFLDLST